MKHETICIIFMLCLLFFIYNINHNNPNKSRLVKLDDLRSVYKRSIPIQNVTTRHYMKNDEYEVYNERDIYGPNQSFYGRLCYKRNTDSIFKKTAFPHVLDIDTFEGGVEDPRLFSFDNENYVIFNGKLKYKKNSRQMFLFNLNKNKLVHLVIEGYDVTKSVQKNWTPYVFDSHMYFLYSIEPVCVLKLTNVNTGVCKLIHGQPVFHTHPHILRGGSCLVPWNYPYFFGCGHVSDPYRAIFYTYNVISHNVTKFDILQLYNDNARINFPYDLQIKLPYAILGCNYEDERDHLFYFDIEVIESYIQMRYNPYGLL